MKTIRVALIACSKQKQKGIHKARDIYTSPLFRYALRYANRFDRVYILSALYVFVHPNTRIDSSQSHDFSLRNMSIEERRGWSRALALRIRRHAPKGARLYWLCGEQYSEFSKRLLSEYVHVAPLAGLKIGQQLQWYKKRCKIHPLT